MRRSLLHIPLESPISYTSASTVQDSIVRRMLDRKRMEAGSLIRPTLLTMEMRPTFTTGRRDRGTMPVGERDRLLRTGASVEESLRGGQTTYHGPGQLVAYPILDLSSHGLNIRPKCYVDNLESVIMSTLAAFDLSGLRTEHTGVWIRHGLSERKVAALGVHLRRNITSHGIALNVCTDLKYFDEIVACGLADKRATSMLQEGCTATLPAVTQVFVEKFAETFGLDNVEVAAHGDSEHGR
ncbi:Octanoyltransferase [Taphrina deformans PYCC 5710]|uniref:Octanoyltransferase n=1 Tax=Taphrina deformans (strain PYCC 5710 / ATCC 11124 / CBS 356.35 / IMI 108563 / JCM 9778 / NBRC 8474) TaxID=1097556 RepID=R4XB34_TAPDE|nr:Octanoyltransferase [Taphrina deformans PYCC 5710]|eukprot:CCG83084.1 Octanoyltransferase [Taphrina deformans PYCC 5710]